MATTSTYVPAVAHMRTDAERRDQVLAWNRPDRAFFAAGACHILAYRLLARLPATGLVAVFLRPRDGLPGSHVYVTDGVRAFDFAGWTPECELLATTTDECRRRWPGWTADRVVLAEDLHTFCQSRGHRPPWAFAGDTVRRADVYLDRLLHTP